MSDTTSVSVSTPTPDSATLLNRELSLLKFNERVLGMAVNQANPLLERLRYLCIVSSNLDEFFEIRISSLKEQERQFPNVPGDDGLTPSAAFELVQQRVHELVDRQYALLNKDIFPALRKRGVSVLAPREYTEAVSEWARDVFLTEVLPLLTPIGLDPAHPFPRVYNKSLNFIVSLSGEDAFGRRASIAIVQAPRALPRLLEIPESVCGQRHTYTLLSSLMQQFSGDLFPGMEVKGLYQWRVTRNSDLFVDEDEVTNLRQALQGELSQRNFGAAVRLEISENTPVELEQFLQREFALGPKDTYRTHGSVNLTRLMPLCDIDADPQLVFPSYRARLPAPFDTMNDNPAEMFDAIAREDLLLHHPYQSFKPVIDFLTSAALDPQVVAIKQTIYRTGEDSELMGLLLAAAKAGKEVTVVVELMARFDEQTNINWAAKLEEVGAHVVYGVVGHKTHAKMLLVLRREGKKIVRYGHLGTGNYHPRTARLYTDFGLLTANPDLTNDMDRVFSLLTGLGARRPLKLLLQSPFTLHDRVVKLIQAETEQAQAGKKAVIMAKMNSLLEVDVINALYKASQAGVRIELIIRGVCALRSGVPGLSENIRVRSIVGRFLEHSRVFYFHAGGQEQVYLSSADWMDRNFFRRVEVAFPILNPVLKKRVINESFIFPLKDNVLAWEQKPSSEYERVKNRREPFNIHHYLMDLLGKAG
ncbi:polyphosphate kinase 1 [Advenella mimigardefordensis]|uniref:Polyphosphate kinase n=1 Tax=Advenella mimigardefordensis (strain DSM 17166 / LMG 22922 / DPN7) TaxID=1247726 RepID=W0PGY5_ADVMD|nr:polyphosphate kinase 1 [Advenella mimigardefordensis]AHG64665.1 polyphosphate kinase [Advenella mimigardefordensis DPN7]